MPFNAIADGSVSAGTCSLTEDCQAGPNSAMPLPTIKQNPNKTCGVTMPSHASTDSAVAPASEIDSEISATIRRSYMSAMAPAGIEISMIGSIKAVCTNATLSADDVICVIAQAAPTPWINSPRLDNRLASQMRRNSGSRSGAATLSAANIALFGVSIIARPNGAGRGRPVIPCDLSDARESPWLSSGQTNSQARYPRSYKTDKTL